MWDYCRFIPGVIPTEGFARVEGPAFPPTAKRIGGTTGPSTPLRCARDDNRKEMPLTRRSRRPSADQP